MTERPDVVLPQTHLEMRIGEGEIYHGSFELINRLDGDIRGLVYPSSFRVHLKDSGFEGNPVTIQFTYDARGLEPGFVEKGTFTAATNGGEFEIPFTAIVEKPYIMTSYGKVQSMRDFRGLACQDFQEAHRLFRSREFYEVLKYEDKRIYSLYDNMRKWSLGEAALEEFLVGTKQKEKLFLTLNEEEKNYENLLEPLKDELILTKNTWGYMEIHVRAEGDFIRILQSRISTDDFLGNDFRLSYVIEDTKLHAGKNYGRIYLETPYDRLAADIMVHQSALHPRKEREAEFLLAQVVKSYLGMCAGKMDLHSWTESAVSKLKALREKEPEQEIYQLILADIYMKGLRIEEAKWILENYTYKKSELGKTPVLGLYYLYLLSMLTRNTAQMEKVLAEMKRVYMKNPRKWQIALMMMHLDPLYAGAGNRLKLLERQFYNRANGIRLYLEAYECYKERPDLMKKLGAFEIQVLHFAVRYKLITRELALHGAELACQQKSYEQMLFRVLVSAYRLFPEPEILTAICMQLIKGHITSIKSHSWYEKAIEAELKIAQLYEFYMLSLDEKHIRGQLPRTIYLYFMHGNTLNDRKAALLYANIITYEDETGELYEGYREQIEVFAWEQLGKRRISDNLRIIYRRFCTEDGMNPVRMKAMYDICHAYQVTTKAAGMKYVLVLEADGTISQRTAYDPEDGAQIFLYDKEARIVWEGKNGWHYADSFAYDTVRMFYEPKFLELCRRYAQTTEIVPQVNNDIELNFENLQKYGMESFEEDSVFCLCSKRIREENYKEDDFLSYLCYELFERGQYDKVILTYLENYYCGATRRMKKIWFVAKEYEVNTKKLAERIITQMLFGEMLYQEEKIFLDYYEGNPYFRVKQAYLAYISREYVVCNRKVDDCVFEIIENEHRNHEEFADICKAALLKYYAGRNIEGREEMLHTFLRDLSMQQMVFPFYLEYPQEWLREVQLYDKALVQYTAEPGSKVRIYYQLARSGVENLNYESEILIPVYENVYVKEFTIYQDETLKYYFCEIKDGKSLTTEKRTYDHKEFPAAGKYGRLNEMTRLSQGELEAVMTAYEKEEYMARNIYHVY